MSRATTELAIVLRAALAAAADPERAIGMRAYMKSEMPYRGIRSATLRAISNHVFAEHPLESCVEWQAAILELWRGAQFREERYAALELVAQKRNRECRTPAVLPMYEELITTGAWWDYVDETAHHVGYLLWSYP